MNDADQSSLSASIRESARRRRDHSPCRIEYNLHANKLSLNCRGDYCRNWAALLFARSILSQCLAIVGWRTVHYSGGLHAEKASSEYNIINHDGLQFDDGGIGGVLAGCDPRFRLCCGEAAEWNSKSTPVISLVFCVLVSPHRRWAERTAIPMGPIRCSTIRCRRAESGRRAKSGSSWPPQLVREEGRSSVCVSWWNTCFYSFSFSGHGGCECRYSAGMDVARHAQAEDGELFSANYEWWR